MRKFLNLLLAFLLAYSYSNSQDFSNKGKDFWVAYGYHQVMTAGNGQEMVLYFATDLATNVTVTIPGIGYSATYNIPANTVFTSNPIPKGLPQDARLLTESTVGENKGIHIVSDQPIVAYAHIYNASVSGASILFPTNTLGREYYSINYTNRSNTANANCWAYVIATDTGTTTVEITPSAATLTRPAGVPFTVTLTQGQVFNIMGQYSGNLGVDLTGTLIKSINTGAGCKKIAVFSGSGRISITCNGTSSSSDNYMSQAFPKNAWGKKYLTATASGNQANNFYRVCVSDPTAVVTVNGGPVGVPLVNGFYYDLPITNQPLLIEANKPIIVAQYFTSQGACGNGNPGDPEVIYLSPVEQNINKVLWNATANFGIQNHYLNVVIPNGGTGVSSFQLRDGTGAVIPTAAFTVHPRDPNYSYLKQPLPSSGVYSIQSDSGFNAIAYGFGAAESYGYNAGTNVVDLFQYVSIQNTNATVNSPLACRSSPFNLSITLPYIPLSIKWVITNYPDVINNAPIPDSTFVLNGKTLYIFRLPTPYVYNAIGIYPVTVTVNNPTPDGCTGEQIINFNLQVFNPPTADFSWTSKGCTDSIIPIITNNTTGGRPITKHFWDFGDGTFAYVNNPTKVYTNPGTYTIRYAVLTDIGCLSDTTVKTISVTRTPTAKFGYVAAPCVGKLITFSDSSLLTGGFGNIVNWNWNLGVGGPINNTTNANVSATYPTTTAYNPTLQVTTNTGCVSPLFTLPITIRPNPVPNFTMNFACLPDGVVTFTNTSTIADGSQSLFVHAWNFGDPISGPLNTSVVTNPTHKYSTVGPFNIKLKVTSNYGCVDSMTRAQANIYPQPKADFTAPAEVCWQTPVTFTDGSNGFTHPVTQWQWRFIDPSNNIIGSSIVANPTFNFPAPGTYRVRHWAFTNQGCVSDTIEKTIIINPWPTADFTLSSPLCEKNQLTLNDNSNPNVGSTVRWYWNIGGTIVNSTNNNPVTQTFTNWGDKVIKLLVENSKGCRSDTLTRTVRVHPLPKPGFILPEVCLTDVFVQFTDTSKIADGTGSTLSYLWNFNAGASPVVPAPSPAISTSKNNTIQYFTSGSYEITSRVTSVAGCVDSIRMPFTVNGVIARSSFAIQPTNGLCSNQDVEIKNTSSVSFGWLTKLQIYWDWANNPTQVVVDDTPPVDGLYRHRYPNFQSPLTRTFQVRFVAYTGIICVKDTIQTITVNASPLTQFTAMPGICLDATPRQITQAVELGGLPGTGVYTGPGVNATGLFNPVTAGVGVHTIRYIFTAASGCTHYTEQTIEVYPRPTAKFVSLLPSCEKNTMFFSDSSVANAASLSNWNFDFGDGTPIVSYPNRNNISHVFANYGNYNVALQVINNRGCTSVPFTLPVKVNPLPRVDFNLPKVCLPAGTATFTDLSTIPDNTQGLFTYKWDFGDGFATPPGSDTSIVKNPIYKYTNLGTYAVSLKITSSNNCVDSTIKQLVDVFPQPKASFSSKDSLCLGDLVNFTDASDGIVRGITQWNWNFGNGVTSSVQNPNYLYTIPGVYNVKLHVFSSEGCVSDTATKTINVWPFPALAPGPDIVMLEDGIRKITEFGATGSGNQYLWTPPTYLDNPTLKNPTIVKPKDDILYTIFVTGRGGCISKTTLFVKVLKMPKPPNTFTPNGDGINDFWEINHLYDYPGCVVEVYNTAGTIVHRSIGYSTPWDGKWKGQQLPAGTYYYVIDPKNGRARIAGYVTILR